MKLCTAIVKFCDKNFQKPLSQTIAVEVISRKSMHCSDEY